MKKLMGAVIAAGAAAMIVLTAAPAHAGPDDLCTWPPSTCATNMWEPCLPGPVCRPNVSAFLNEVTPTSIRAKGGTNELVSDAEHVCQMAGTETTGDINLWLMNGSGLYDPQDYFAGHPVLDLRDAQMFSTSTAKWMCPWQFGRAGT